MTSPIYTPIQSSRRSLDKGKFKEEQNDSTGYDNNGCVEMGKILFGTMKYPLSDFQNIEFDCKMDGAQKIQTAEIIQSQDQKLITGSVRKIRIYQCMNKEST